MNFKFRANQRRACRQRRSECFSLVFYSSTFDASSSLFNKKSLPLFSSSFIYFLFFTFEPYFSLLLLIFFSRHLPKLSLKAFLLFRSYSPLSMSSLALFRLLYIFFCLKSNHYPPFVFFLLNAGYDIYISSPFLSFSLLSCVSFIFRLSLYILLLTF